VGDRINSASDFAQVLRSIDYGHSDFMEVLQLSVQSTDVVQGLRDGPWALVPSADGIVSVVRHEEDPADFSRLTDYFDLHTDGLYRTPIPDYVCLYCESPGRGIAQTVLSDTSVALDMARRAGVLETLESCEVVYLGKRGGSFPQSLVGAHPVTAEPIIHLGSRCYIRPRPDLEVERVPSLRQLAECCGTLFKSLDASTVVRHTWRRGQIMLFDNHRFLHGRSASGPDATRVLLRFWLTRGLA
jgi:alpha-ketoglutarate-dependent taurine dioxygenase